MKPTKAHIEAYAHGKQVGHDKHCVAEVWSLVAGKKSNGECRKTAESQKEHVHTVEPAHDRPKTTPDPCGFVCVGSNAKTGSGQYGDGADRDDY
jgi:hypothetical protein